MGTSTRSSFATPAERGIRSSIDDVALRGTPWIRPSSVAATALPTIGPQPTDGQEARLADIYDSLRGGPEHSKYTQSLRLSEWDRRLAEILATMHAGSATICVHDMAASNAITALEMFEHLKARLPVNLRASDYYDRVDVVDAADCGWRVVFDVDGRPIQYVGPRLMLCARRPDPSAPPADTIIRPRLQAMLLPPALAALAGADDPSSSAVGEAGHAFAPVPLFHPRCRYRAATDTRFTLTRDDVFHPTPGRYDVVRIANMLSTAFMSEARVLQGVRAVLPTLADGGLLVLVRNAEAGDGPPSGTVFVREGDGLRLVEDMFGGYQMRDAVLQLTAA